MFRKIIFIFATLVAAMFVIPVMAQDACEGQVGAAFGLCNAYCEAMDCDSADQQASDKACNKVYDKFFTHAGTPPPCEVSCPCFTLDDLQAGGEISECGENFSSPFDDLAGIIYTPLAIACSGFNCATMGTTNCSYLGGTGTLEGITETEDAGCRTLILAACDTPNVASSQQTQSASSSDDLTLFINQ